eukprot:2456661-Pyramimonas_sp.AAC.1
MRCGLLLNLSLCLRAALDFGAQWAPCHCLLSRLLPRGPLPFPIHVRSGATGLPAALGVVDRAPGRGFRLR